MTDDIQKILRELHDDPEMFVRYVLHATPQSWQADALRAVRDNSKVAIKSGHGVGKTAFCRGLCCGGC